MKNLKLIPLFFLSLVLITRVSSSDSSEENSVDDTLDSDSDKPIATTRPEASRTEKHRKKNFLGMLNFFKKKSANRTDSRVAKKKQGHRLVTKSVEPTKSSDSNDSGLCPFGCKYLLCYDTTSIDLRDKRSVFNYFRKKFRNDAPRRPQPVRNIPEPSSDDESNFQNEDENNDNSELQ
ncbi:hypothetical protein BpHYR1_040104 [Brachionus plicatilis]|uniref:Uncharacterized protein n=1 Tax=Brachionus plicatilis TaxID=10195 RepID=A0A3M7T8S7_BRAPC|nr:hypothetical protein BpHYR1_040104 [Brachionus plicatilis]